jgi:3-hydroxymyristoyl/3-hydroxydecanoyl-(acyl carrier protein) dehydratase
MKKYSLPCPVKNLIPHSGAMLFVDELRNISGADARCFYRVKKNIFSEGISSSPFLFVELFAQSAAAFAGYNAAGNPSGSGFLTGIDNLNINSSLNDGDEIDIKVRKAEQFGPVSFFECSAENKGSVIAAGTIKVWSGEVPASEKISNSPFSPGPAKNDILKYIKNINTSNNSIEATLCFEKDFCCFDGHFDAMPVVPALALMRASLCIAELASEKKLVVRKISSAKFSRRAGPGETVKFIISPDGVKSSLSVNGEKTAFFVFELAEGAL